MASGFLRSPDRTVAGIARKVGEEAYFHLKYASGWMRILESSDDDRSRVQEVMSHRWPLALRWFGPSDATDQLFDAGWRDDQISEIRSGFTREAQESIKSLDVDLAQAPEPTFTANWRPRARRTGP